MAILKEINNRIPAKQFLEITLFGIISGMPLPIFFTVLVTWLTEYGVTLSLITSIAIARIPYGFKYLWAPIIDGYKIPFLSKIGQRKSWMLLTIILNSIILVAFSFLNPRDNFLVIYCLAIGLGLISATYDIAFDAFRVDTVKSEDQGYAASCTVLGYRLGMLISNVGALYISSFFGWSASFLMLASILLMSLLFLPMLNEPVTHNREYRSFFESLRRYVFEPFADFLTRENAIIILVGIMLYKLGGVLLGITTTRFYLELGYTKIQIATIAKGFGLGATLFGSFLGGLIVARAGILRGLILCSVIQGLVHGVYIWLHSAEVSNLSLIIAITIENIGSSAGSCAEVAYISYLCNKTYSATQFALLSSAAVLLNSILGSFTGALVELLGWDMYFIATVILSFPSTLIFLYLLKQK